jgi:glycerol uptake facilitator-like aquaporin
MDVVNELQRLDWLSIVVEFLGSITFMFMAISSSGSILSSESGAVSDMTIAGISTSFGLSYLVTTFLFHPFAYSVLNPAITLALLLVNKIDFVNAIFYTVAEFAGAIIGSLLARVTVSGSALNILQVNKDTSNAVAFVMEILLTMVMTAVFLTAYDTTDASNEAFMSPVLVSVILGSTLALCISAGIGVDGASINPSRWLGTAVWSGNFNNHWVFWGGPLVGGLSAAILFIFLIAIRKFQKSDNQVDREENA